MNLCYRCSKDPIKAENLCANCLAVDRQKAWVDADRDRMDAPKTDNPKEAFGSAKPPLSCVPAPVLYELGIAMLEGALKYGRHNFRDSSILMSTYYDATMRHITSWWEGEDIDPESGLPHIVKAMGCLVVLRDAQMVDKVIDDRPPSHPDGWQDKYKAMVAELRAKYPDPVPPFIRETPPPAKKLADRI